MLLTLNSCIFKGGCEQIDFNTKNYQSTYHKYMVIDGKYWQDLENDSIKYVDSLGMNHVIYWRCGGFQ